MFQYSYLEERPLGIWGLAESSGRSPTEPCAIPCLGTLFFSIVRPEDDCGMSI